MSLINGMTVDSMGGVQIKEYYSYYTYTKTNNGSICSETIENITGNTVTDLYIIPYKNTNPNFSLNIYNDENVLNLELSGTTISEWITNYVNSIASTGYTGYDGSEIEDRYVYDSTGNTFYKIEHINTGNTDNNPMLVIYDTINESYWDNSGNDYFYNEIDECGNETGNKIVEIIDINIFSETYLQRKYIIKCSDDTYKPTITTNDVTDINFNSATFNAEITDIGSSVITERGFCYSILTNPDINDFKIINVSGDSTFYNILNNLFRDKYYYVRAYAINSHGISYGNEINFKTLL